MRHFLSLSHIKATDPLAQLFNAYLKGLSTPASCVEPMYVTMREVRQGFIEGSKKKDLKRDAEQFYALTVLSNSLDSIHEHVIGAIDVLEKFFDNYSGSLTAFAIGNRIRLIDEYGSDDQTDWQEDGFDEEGKQKWEVVYKDDPESLTHYTLWEELTRFMGSDDNRGEYLGRSTHEDFYPYTSVVHGASVFSFRKMMEAMTGQEANLVQVQADGGMVPLTLADHIESEMNEDITNAEVVRRFDMTLYNLGLLGKVFHRGTIRHSEKPDMYRSMLNLLVSLRDQTLTPEGELPGQGINHPEVEN